MRDVKGSAALKSLMAAAVCGALTAPAQAWSWPWAKTDSTASAQTSSSAAAPEAAKPSATAAGRRKDGTVVESGTVESLDAARRSLILKTGAGKSESFALVKSSSILKHHKKLAPSALKMGARVNVYHLPGKNEAVRVYLLGSQKA